MASPTIGTSGGSGACFPASEGLWKRVIVRNTFIDLADELPEVRPPRASSAPAPLLRLRSPCTGDDRCGGPEEEEDASTDGGETGSFADSSSAADGGETGSFADSSSAVEADAMSLADSEEQPPPPEPPRVPPGAFLALPPSGGGSAQGQRLSSSAKVFTPSAPAPATPPGSRKFRRELQALANAVRGALEGHSDVVVGAEAGYSPQGWFVSASISARSLHARELLLAQAREAICGARMKHSRVMGCGAQPFQPTPLGFAARIGHVPDEEKACWNLMQHGFCRHGEFCHWQHPSVQTILSVKVVVVAE